MKLRAQKEGLGIRVTMAALLVADALVKLTADNTVNVAGANDFVIGRVSVAPKTSGGLGTVECIGRIKEKIEIKVNQSGGLVAGDFVKMAAVDGTTGENRVAKWVTGTDAFERLVGIVCKGAADAGVAEVLTF